MTAALCSAGCTTGSSVDRGTDAGPGALGGAGFPGDALSPTLDAQRSRLLASLRGTPVVIEATADRSLRVVVPLRHGFDAGSAALKPAASAVLDQLALGFKPHAANAELRLGVPDDGTGKVRLAQERASSMRKHLLSRGVPASRIVDTGHSGTDTIEILIVDRPVNK